MKIKDLEKGRYVIVYDMGKSEYSEGRTIVGKVVGNLEVDEEGKNTTVIESLPFHRYTISDNNHFDYWNDYMESITEHTNNLNDRWARKLRNLAQYFGICEPNDIVQYKSGSDGFGHYEEIETIDGVTVKIEESE